MNYLEQNAATGRVILPDLVRAFALFGIALVNVQVLAFPMMGGFHEGGLMSLGDDLAFFTTNSFFLMKSYTLFAFMFGVGFAYQIVSAERRGAKFGGEYFRRILGLIVLGLLHVALLFQGDILVLYAIFGTILFIFRNKSARFLKNLGIGVYIFQVLLAGFFALAMWAGYTFDPDSMAEMDAEFAESIEKSFEIFGSGSFGEAVALRFAEWSEVIVFGSLMQGFGAFAFFAFGMAAVRSDIINQPGAPIWRKFRRVYLPIGIIGSLLAGYIILTSGDAMGAQAMLGMFLIALFSPFSTAGYLGLIAKWADGPMTKTKEFLARGGTATLTAYLMQGLLFSLIFNAYGLGLYADLTAWQCVLLAFFVALFTISFSSLWRTKFERGPMEVLLRRWTYLGNK